MPEYVTERFQGSYEEVAPLLAPDVEVERTVRDLEWKCARGPHGPGDIWVIRAGTEIAAMVSMYRRNILLGSRVVPGCQNADLIVNPNHRRKGLAVRVLQDCFADAARVGYQVAYGFPNVISTPAQRHAGGWTELGTMQLALHRPNALHSAARRAVARVPGAAGRAVGQIVDLGLASRKLPPRQVGEFDVSDDATTADEYGPFWSRIVTNGGYLPVRDFMWHRWRFFDKPDYRCKLLYARAGGVLRGYVAIRFTRFESGMEGAAIVDVLATDSAAERALLASAPAHAAHARAVELTFTRIGKVAPTLPYPSVEQDTGAITFVRALQPEAVGSLMPPLPEWRFTSADSDVT